MAHDNQTNITGQGSKRSSGEKHSRRAVEILPHPEVLEAYNYVVEGSASRIIEMFEREQQHRHAWERNALKTHTFSAILGQILGFVVALSMFISATIIGITGDSTIAAFIWVFGMAIVVMAGIVWLYAKSMGQRPLFGRPAMRTHFRPEKQGDESSING